MLPVPLLAAAAIASYFVYDEFSVKASGKARPQVPPILAQEGQPRKLIDDVQKEGAGIPANVAEAFKNSPMPEPKLIGRSPAGNPIVSIAPTNPDTGKSTVTFNLATQGQAATDAHLLYDYLIANPPNKAAQNAEMTSLVQAFQKSHNIDFDRYKVGGRLTLTGLYDLPTASALTVYTGMAIPSNPDVPMSAVESGIGGTLNPAALTASNLYAYLKTHKNNKKDVNLKALVKAFQIAVNTDPKFPGPALTIEGKKWPNLAVIKKPLATDGLYGPGTADALAVSSFERIAP